MMLRNLPVPVGLGIVNLLLVLTTSACSAEPAAPPPTSGPSADDISAIRRMDTQFRDLVVAKDWSGVAKLFSEKAVLLPPNAPLVNGASAIAEYFGSSKIIVQEFSTTSEAIGGSGSLAVNRGSYRMVVVPDGAAAQVTDVGKYLWVMQRQQDNSWRITAATWNSDAPPPGHRQGREGAD